MNLPADFQPFTTLHAATAGLCIGLIVASILLGRRWARRARTAHLERRLRTGWCAFTLIWQAIAVVWLFLPMNWDPRLSLPLHICDLAAWIAPLALLTQHRWLRTMLYYWGIGLSTQAFITPTVNEGPAHWFFWFFWVGHLQIVGSACYDLVVLRYRPTWRDAGVAAAISLAYGGAMFTLNAATGFNYGFLGPSRPTNPTLIDHLGAWPLRALWLTLIVLTLFALITLPWRLARRVRPRPAAA